MPLYLRDTTGRFQQRPHYKPEELDRECETIITAFLREIHGKVEYPVATNDLTKLVERDAEDLDLYADLSPYGEDVEGVTEFRRGRKPRVSIAEFLSKNQRRENRLRTTITHEYGHLRFHGYLWETEPPSQDLLRRQPHCDKIICKRDTMIQASQTDWMEWQAGYISGALLMPKTAVERTCAPYIEAHSLYGSVSLQTAHAEAIIASVVEKFQVSEEAARVRLLKLRIATSQAPTPSLFG